MNEDTRNLINTGPREPETMLRAGWPGSARKASAHHARLALLCAAVWVGLSLLATDTAAARIELNVRRDTKLNMMPAALALVDESTRVVAIGGSHGLQIRRSDGTGLLELIGKVESAQPVSAVAACRVGGAHYLAYTVRGESLVHIVPTSARGTLGSGPTVHIDGRPRTLIAAAERGFIAVHSGGVDLLEPASAGAFRRRKLSDIGSITDAAVIDLNGDEAIDLILADQPLGEIVVLRGLEDGGMKQVATLRTQRAPRRVVVANFDGDSDEEIVVLGDLGLSIHDRAHSGAIEPEKLIYEAPQLSHLATADLDGNGIADLVFTDRSRSVAASLLASRRGRFSPGPAFLTGRGPGRVLAAALTSDKQGLLIANELGDSLTHIARDRRGLTGVAAVLSSIGKLSDAAIADFDGDGNLDMALTGDDTGRLEVLLGLGNGHFTAQPSTPIGMRPRSIISGDWNRDGHIDLAAADFGADQVAIMQGNGRGSFSVPVLINVERGPSALLHGDFGGPAGNDIVVANKLSDTISILHGSRSGRFTPGPTFKVAPRPAFLLTGDFDGDRDADLIAGSHQYETITIVPREPPGFGTPYHKVLAEAPTSPAATDLDGDGIPEILATNASEGTIEIMRRRNGSLRNGRKIQVGRRPSLVKTADIDADGKEDLVVVHRDSAVVAIFLRMK